MMKFKLICIIAVLLLSGTAFSSAAQAQEALSRHRGGDFARNSIFVEVLGNGLLYSLNYDHKIFNHLSARLGGMYVGGLESEDVGEDISLLFVPVMANYLVGNGNSRLEIGAGITFGHAGGDWDGLGEVSGGGVTAFTSTIGYRLQPVDGGFLFRIGFTPTFTSGGVVPLIGLSLGGTF